MSIPKETLLHAYRTMKTIREFEERVNAEIMNGQIPGFTHLYTGQEANAVGVCAHLDESDTTPESVDDHYYLAVMLSNRGDHERALREVDAALSQRPESRKAHYLKASILAATRDRRAALDALSRAIDLDDQNRIYAANDPDFSGLRDDEEFITLTTREDHEEL